MGVAPLQYWLFTPELQWQSRGQQPVVKGLPINSAAHRGARVVESSSYEDTSDGLGAGSVCVSSPFDAGCVPLNDSGNPGVNDESYRGV